jgi:cation:H+ antiporter
MAFEGCSYFERPQRVGSFAIGMPSFETFSLTTNVILFVVAGALVWLAGMRISAYADELARQTGIGRAFIGALLLGGITSLPEGVTTITASAIGNASLAVNNLFGGVAMQVAVLAAADVVHRQVIGRQAKDGTAQVQAALLVLLLAVAAAGIIVGDILLIGVGLWTTGLLAVTITAFFLIHRAGAKRATGAPEAERRADTPVGGLVTRIVVAAIVIVLAGIVLAKTGDTLADQTGLGSQFVGAVFVAIATSLPEVSTTLGALRVGAYTMAFANIFGANLLDLSILFLADVVYVGEPVLNLVGGFSAFAALLATALTAVFLVGLLWPERNETRIGVDSVVVLILYAAGLALMFSMR